MDSIPITAGSSDVTTYAQLLDATTGDAVTGLTVTDLDLTYVRAGDAASTKADASALSAADDAHADNSMIEVDATNLPGLYRVDWPDAAFASGVPRVTLGITGSAIKAHATRADLLVADLFDGANLGLTALPSANPAVTGGLPTVDASNRVAGVAGSVDVGKIFGSSAAAEAQKLAMDTLAQATVSNAVASPTTTEVRTTTITEATDNHFVGRTVVFTSGGLLRQFAEITGYTLTSGEGVFTITELTEAPANGDTFLII